MWGRDDRIGGERSVLRILPEHHAAVALMTNDSTGRAMYRFVFAELMAALFGIRVPPLRLDTSAAAAGHLARFAGRYAWPDRTVEVTAAASGPHISSEDGKTLPRRLDERTFIVDPSDPDNSTVTFGAFDGEGRPHVLYRMLWGLPRVDMDQAAERVTTEISLA